MPTINHTIAKKIIAEDGYYEDDPRVYMVLKYQNIFDGDWSYAIAYTLEQAVNYILAPNCKDPMILWGRKGAKTTVLGVLAHHFGRSYTIKFQEHNIPVNYTESNH